MGPARSLPPPLPLFAPILAYRADSPTAGEAADMRPEKRDESYTGIGFERGENGRLPKMRMTTKFWGLASNRIGVYRAGRNGAVVAEKPTKLDRGMDRVSRKSSIDYEKPDRSGCDAVVDRRDGG